MKLNISKKILAIGLGVVLVGAIGFAAVSASSNTPNNTHPKTVSSEAHGQGRGVARNTGNCNGHGVAQGNGEGQGVRQGRGNGSSQSVRQGRGNGRGQGQGNGSSQGQGNGSSQSQGKRQGRGNDRSQGIGKSAGGHGEQSSESHAVPADQWIAVTGKVGKLSDNELTLETDDGTMEIGLGPIWYWDAHGISLNEGDNLTIKGFQADEFEPGQVIDNSTGESVTLRTDQGAPLWAGGGH
jgi:hypothetical protein